MSRKLTTEEFIKRSIQTHGNKYNYSMVNYINQLTKVKIICSIHGTFEQLPSNHYKYGCLKCSGKNKLMIKEFIKRARKIHNDKYTYPLINFKSVKDKILIYCHIHGEFKQKISDHIYNKTGCPKCANKNITNSDFIKKSIKVHGDKYDYSLVDYVNCNTKIIIICKLHGEFKQTPDVHLNNSGCPECAIINSRLSKNDFIKKSKEIHGNNYDYSLVDYVNQRTKIKIICTVHGVFEQTPNKHLQNRGCPTCKKSKGELKIKKFLDDNSIKYEQNKKFENCKYINHLLFDFYLNEFKTCIEYDGEQHFIPINKWGGEENLKNNKIRDNIKNEYCINNDIKLIRIKYTENIIDILKNNILKNDCKI